MPTSTQISGNIRPGNTALLALKDTLTHLGITVTHSALDESLFYAPDATTAWHQYESELAFYESIAGSAFHIIYNDGAIDEKIGTQILYAMAKGRPIVMTGAPHFADDLNPYVRFVIYAHLPTFHSVNLPELDLTELSELLAKLEATDYQLTGSERILIKARVRAHFQSLADETHKRRLEQAQNLTRPVEEV